MPTFRSALLARRSTFLERHALRDDSNCPPSLDKRLAFTRLFLEGGDDIAPGCLPDGVQPPRRPPFSIAPKLAGFRLKPPDHDKDTFSDSSDWDRYAAGPWRQVALERIIAQIVRAAEIYRTGVRLTFDQVFDLQISKFPSLDESRLSMTKAWALLAACGCNQDKQLSRFVTGAFQSAYLLTATAPPGKAETPGTADAWRGVIAAASADVRGSMNVFWDQNMYPVPGCPGAPPEPAEPPMPGDCGCQPSPEPVTPGTPPPPPDVSGAQAEAADAVLAAMGPTPPDSMTALFRAAHFTDATIVALYKQLTADWANVPDDRKYINASPAWEGRHPEFAIPVPQASTVPEPTSDTAWTAVTSLVQELYLIAQRFATVDSQPVRTACASIVKGTWTDESKHPFPNKDDATLSGYNPGSFAAAADRAAARPDDCPFRLAALLNAPEGYSRVLDNLSPSGEDGTGANRLARPTYDPLGAFYWRNAAIGSTIGNLLTRADTADFHAVSHTRYLGLFRRGGKLRPGAEGSNTGPMDGDFEQWIAQLVPDWFLDFAKAALLRFKYWLEDPPTHRQNDEEMTFWSENHQVNFAASEYITGRWWKNEEFTCTGQTGDWHAKRALARVEKWLQRRLQFGFSEVDSGTYYNQHLPPLFNLIDFACLSTGPDAAKQDPEGFRIRQLALMATDIMVFDVVRRMCEGSFVAASGRAYYGSKSSGWEVSIVNFIEILTGLIGDFTGPSETTALDFVTSDYVDLVPEALIALGLHRSGAIVDRSRTSIDLSDGEQYGITFKDSADIVFWWGCGAYFTDDTFAASRTWSEHWSLRHTGPFVLYKYIDSILLRFGSAVAGFVEAAIPIALSAIRQAALDSIFRAALDVFGSAARLTTAGAMTSVSDYPVGMLHAAMMSPLVLRVALDALLAFADALLEVFTWGLKEVSILDENDDRVRIARTRLEQAFQALVIDFNAGSVLGRQRMYGWRGADGALSSMVEDHKAKTTAQKEPCIASLGPNVSIFTGKPLKQDFPGWRTAGNAIEGYARGSLKYLYDPDAFIKSQAEVFDGQSAPEAAGLAVPIVGAFFRHDIFGEDGPGYWFGSISSALVYQHENTAIVFYRPTPEQKDLAPEMTHVHWPWDHFDEVQTDEAAGGRWVFGRRDRRFPPRTPCHPGKHWPSKETPWPKGKFHGDEAGPGSGYVALFSARGLKTIVPDPGSVDSDGNFVEGNWGHKELQAEGHDNIFVIVVGDRLTYATFEAFHEDVLAARLTCSVDDGKCSITLPNPGSASGEKGVLFEATWDGGAKVDNVAVDTSSWPRFELQPTSIQAVGPADQNPLVRGFRVFDPSRPDQDGVPWDAKGWRMEVTVSVWELDDAGKQHRTETTLHLEHDWVSWDSPARDAGALAPNQSLGPVKFAGPGTLSETAEPVQSVLGKDFRAGVGNDFRSKVLYGRSK